jgi:hypothetical protein
MAHRPAMRQAPCFDRLRALVVGHSCTVGRHTITQALMARGLVDADWSAFYRLFSMPRPDDDVLTRCFLHETPAQVPADDSYAAAVNGGQLPRDRPRMPGVSWLKCPRTLPFKPGVHRAQRLRAPGDAAAARAGLQPGAALALGARLPAQGRAGSGHLP